MPPTVPPTVFYRPLPSPINVLPMTLRLYHADSTLRDFTARIVARRDTERGPAVRLDRTAFYPTAGGQPHDTGTL
ncbi:MAG: hypothetical protein OEW56_07990, partial [Gemmatimonadota bacterium]|nr:hypothetical protein [Gemmatimonadota bacterium]